MGRKRRSAKAEQQGAGAGSTNNKDDSVTTLLPHHVEDLLFSLLDVIGCFGSNEEHLVTTTTTAAAANRQCLVQSLTSLSSKLAVFHQENRETNSQGTHTTDTEKVCRHLRLVEAAVADFRNRAEAFLESMDAERSEVGHLSQCIHSALFHIEQDRQISLVSWHILVRSLVEQYRAHTWVEEETILGLLSTTRTSDSAATATALDELYITESLDEQLDQKISTEHPVHVLLRCLSRHALTQQSQFQDVVCMLKESLLNDKFDKSLVRTPTIQSCSMPAAENTDGVPLPLECDSTYVSSAASADDDDTVWTANSPMCAVEAFLRSSTHPTNSNVTALLVVGSEGSGKTHLCGAMERLIQLSSPLTKSKSIEEQS